MTRRECRYGDAAAVENYDLIGVHDRATRWATMITLRTGFALQCGPKHLVGLEVDRREAIVEDEDLGRLMTALAMARRWRWPPRR